MGKKIDTDKFFQKKREKQQQKLPRFRCLCTDYSWEIHAISLTINRKDISIYHNLKHKKHPCKPAIANDFKLPYMKRIEGRSRLTELVQYYFINIVLSVNLKKKRIENS